VSAAVLVVRRAGSLWAVPAAAVAGIERGERGVEVRLTGGGRLDAESVVALAAGVAVRPCSAALRRRLPDGVAGLALYRREPVMVVDATMRARGGHG
jgi:hypothetical protein